jgi:hypothetical protein
MSDSSEEGVRCWMLGVEPLPIAFKIMFVPNEAPKGNGIELRPSPRRGERR